MAVTKMKKQVPEDIVRDVAVRKLTERGYTTQEAERMLRLAEMMVGGKHVVVGPEEKRITERDLNELSSALKGARKDPENAKLAMSEFRPAGPEAEVPIGIPKPPRRREFSLYDVMVGEERYAVEVRKDLSKVVEKPTSWIEKTKAYQLRAALLSGDVIAVTTEEGKTMLPRDFLSLFNEVYTPLSRKPDLTPEEIYEKIAIHKRGRRVVER